VTVAAGRLSLRRPSMGQDAGMAEEQRSGIRLTNLDQPLF
jgi:hypothetical protein